MRGRWRGMGKGARVGAAALAFALVASVLTGCSQAPRVEEDLLARPYTGRFYDDPPSATGTPGTVVRAEITPGAPEGSTAWRILFRSTELDGRTVLNSGMLVVPDGAAPLGGRTIVSWGHPTTGSAEKCAPSRSVDPYFWMEGLPDLLAQGYAVVATDYTGMGVPGPDSYLVGATEGRNVLDAARAARNVLGTDASDRLLLWGHSQGGQAVLFATELWKQYAPELDLRGVAVAAPAADLASLLRADIGDLSGVSIGSYAFAAYAQVYGADVGTILTPAAVAALPTINGFCLITQNDALHAVAKPLIGRFVTGDPETTEPWATLLRQNTPGSARLPVPLLVAQGLDDTLVRPESTAAFVDHERQLGTAVTYHEVPGATHATIADRALPAVLGFLRDAAKG
ncbi:alpha/beta fold hydrolase [Leifsonia shinshuensis]|uniref:alpha/beta fold hydrolase n=1 Tax=Leifsonia shinshuensis TaxID=150026 RepID=UPI00285D5D5E|nr:alpha/beta fold hydrolase [Leifsonia shinshuensis]MDR6971996.1 pimeloyl-ACP methyl ester carboxylesterase [Leifsonia shinshuensis]